MKSNKKCFECKVENVEFHKHHIVPKSKGGTKTVLLCLDCHGKAHNRLMTSSALVKSAYQRLKKRFGEDLRWGNPNIEDAGLIGRTNNSKAAEDFWRDILAVEVSLHATMPTWSQQKRIDQINFMGYKTRQGKKITRQNLCAAHRRYNTGGIKNLKELIWPNTQYIKKEKK